MIDILKYKKFLILLFLFSFLTRAIFFYFYLAKDNSFYTYDTKAYHEVANKISQGEGISNLNGSTSFYRVPGYSLFLAGCYKFFGLDIKDALWIQILIASLIPVLIFFLSLTLFPKNILLANITSIFVAIFHLGFNLFAGFAMTESFFIFFWLLFLIFFLPEVNFFFCSDNKTSSSKKIFLSGIFLGFASMFRPIGHYLIVVGILLFLFSKFSLLIRFKNSLIFFGGWFLIVIWWLLRNYLLTGFIFFHTLPGIHFLKHSASRIVMNIDGCSYNLACNKVFAEEACKMQIKKKQLNRNLTDIEVCKIQEDIFKKYLFKDLWTSFKFSVLNMIKTCFSLYSAELLYIDSKGELPNYDIKRNWKDIFNRFLFPDISNKGLIIIIYSEILFFTFILIGFIGFLIKSFFLKDYLCVLLKIFPFIVVFILITSACGFARLRLPIEPFLIILSFKFWLHIKRRAVGDL